MSWFHRPHVPLRESRMAHEESLALAMKNNDLIKREGEIVAKEMHAAETYKDKRESNGFLEMIEEVFLPERR
jgi:hypothetical protein